MINAGFDFDLEMTLAALNRTLDGILTSLLIGGVTKFTQPLGVLGPLNFGTFEGDLTGARITALRPVGIIRHGVEADLDVMVHVRLTSINLLGVIFDAEGDLKLPFQRVGLDLAKTTNGVPLGLTLQIKGSHLGTPQFTSPLHPSQPVGGPLAGFVQVILSILQLIIPPLLQAGFAIAAALVATIPITIKEIIDVFSVYGLRFFAKGIAAQDSPFVTALSSGGSDNLLVAADFQRLAPSPTGDPNLLADILQSFPGNTIGVVLGQGGINQAIDILLGKGVIPSMFRGGGFTFYLKQHDLMLFGPASAADPNDPSLGAIELDFVLKGKRGSCWCKVKVTVFVKLRLWPKVVPGTIPAPVGGLTASQQGTMIQFDFDDKNRVKISGFLITLTEIILGPLLILYLFLLSQIANAYLTRLLPYTYSTNIIGNQISVTFSSVQVAAYLTLTFDFAVSIAASGSGSMDISQYTRALLVNPQIFPGLTVDQKNSVDLKIDYQPNSLRIEDGEIGFFADLSR